MKCLIKETFATADECYVRGKIVELPYDEAKKHEYNGLLAILNPDEHLPIAFETAVEAQTGREEARPERKPRKPRTPKIV